MKTYNIVVEDKEDREIRRSRKEREKADGRRYTWREYFLLVGIK